MNKYHITFNGGVERIIEADECMEVKRESGIFEYWFICDNNLSAKITNVKQIVKVEQND